MLFTGTFKRSDAILFIIYGTKREVGLKVDSPKTLFPVCCVSVPEGAERRHCQPGIPVSHSAGRLTVTCHSRELPTQPFRAADGSCVTSGRGAGGPRRGRRFFQSAFKDSWDFRGHVSPRSKHLRPRHHHPRRHGNPLRTRARAGVALTMRADVLW